VTPALRPGPLLVAIALPTALAVLLLVTWSPKASVLDQLLPAAVLALVVGVIAHDALAGRLDPFAPRLPALVMLGVLFGARPIAMTVTGDYTVYGLDMRAQFTSVALMGFLSTVAFVAGSVQGEARAAAVARADDERGPSAGSRGRRRPDLEPTSRGVIPAVLLGILGLGLFAVNLIRNGGLAESLATLARGRSAQSITYLSDSSEYLSAGPVLLAVGAVVVVAATRGRLRPGEWVLCSGLVSVAVMAFLLTGSRRFIIPSVLVPVVLVFLLRGSRPRWRVLAVLGVLGFLVLGTIPYVRAEGARTNAGFATLLLDGVTSPVASAQTFIAGHDTEMFPALGVEKRAIDDGLGYGLGAATVGDLLLAPVPSLVFPDKPMTDRDQVLVQTFGASCAVTEGGVCPDFSATGTFYRDLGYPGVALGCWLLGLVSGRLRVGRRPRVGTAVLSAAWLVMLPVIVRAGFMPAFTWFLYFAVPSLVVLRLISRRGREVVEDEPVDQRAGVLLGLRS
jgi:hypothetical protein